MADYFIEPPKKGVDKYMIMGDLHTDQLNLKCFKLAIKTAKIHNVTNLIVNGDLLDAVFLMAKNDLYKRWIKRIDGIEDFFIPTAEAEFAWGNWFFDTMQKQFKNIIYVEGNHDWRYFNFQQQINHCFRHNFDVKTQLKLKERGIKYIHYNDWINLGPQLAITHGMYHGTSACKNHMLAAGTSVIFSHIHQEQVMSFVRRGNTISARSLPSMADLNPDYIKNRENNWSLGFGEIYLLPDGNWNFYCYTMWDNKIVLPGGKILK